MRRLTIASSLVLLGVAASAVLGDSVFTEWRSIQEEYAAFLRGAAGTGSQVVAQANFPIELRQYFLPALGRVDRCATCHVGVENPAAKDLEQPLRTHPGDYLQTHDVERFGCTICHDGQGRATVARDAMARDAGVHFELPALGPPFIQARCYRCHDQPLDDTPVFNRGRELFSNRGCGGCHRVAGEGGVAGPSLDGISDAAVSVKHPSEKHGAEILAKTNGNQNLAYIYESIRYPAAVPEGIPTTMFDIQLSDDDVLALTVYIKSFEQRDVTGRNYVPRDARPAPTASVNGAAVFARFCSACHGPEGIGGQANPNAVATKIPTLQTLNEKLLLFERADAEVLLAATRADPGEAPSAAELDVPRAPVVAANYRSVLGVVRNGNPSGRVDPKGPPPLDMPSWKGVLDDTEVAAVLGYILRLGEYDDEDDNEEDE